MTDLPQCPSDDELGELAVGSLQPERFEAVFRHLQNCQRCHERLSMLEDRRDPFVASLAGITNESLLRIRSEMLSESQTGEVILTRLLSRQDLSQGAISRQDLTLKVPCRIGQYEVEHLIARGGMGEVYAARHTRLDRPVALKVLRSFRQDDPVSSNRFLDEMHAVGQLQNPNLVQAFDAWEDDGQLYIVFERLSGRTLQQIVNEEGVLKPKEAVAVLLAVCNALEYAHAKGFVHRDVKPANIMRTASGEIKLLDLGLAYFTGHQGNTKTASASTVGTPGYMSPEQQASPDQVDARTDIYSLGCVLSFLLTGKVPGKTPDELHQQSAPLTTVWNRMLAADPERRYPSIVELRADLTRLKSQLDTTASPARSRWKFLWLALFVAMIGVGFSFRAEILLRLRNQESLDDRIPDPEQIDSTAGHQINQISELPTPVPDSLIANRVNLKPIQDSIGISLIELPAEEFVMGGSPDDPLAGPTEFPQRSVLILKPFCIGQYEVTVGQFRKFVAATGYATAAESNGEGGWRANGGKSWGEKSPDVIWSAPGYATSDDHPVSVVTYADAEAFCQWLSKSERQKYRLPTEAEWEYACRAGTTTPRSYPPDLMPDYCWFRSNIPTAEARPVGRRLPNPWGLYDMNGNVREWCLDWYSATAYQVQFASQPSGPLTGDKRVIRGGCFMDLDAFLRSSHRGFLDPHESINNQGFRVVRELP